jgi:putative membrane protein
MKSALGCLLSMLVLFGASSCVAPPDTHVVDCADFVETPTEYHLEYAGRAGMLTQQEHSFVCSAAVLSQAQASSALMAQQRSASPVVTTFAADTLVDQERLGRHLADIAEEQAGLIPPRGIDAAHLAMLDELSRLSGDAFDRAYLQYQLQAGQATIAVFQEEIAAGSEPVLRRFALHALPVVEQRLRETQNIIDRLPG